MPAGGKRPGSGRKKGGQNKSTIEKKAAEEELKQRVLRSLHPLLSAQIELAKGITHVYRIDKTYVKKTKSYKVEHVLVTDPQEIKEFLDEHEGSDGDVDDVYYYITTKSPDNGALNSLFDRVFGKARQTVGLDGGEGGAPIKITGINYIVPKKDGNRAKTDS